MSSRWLAIALTTSACSLNPAFDGITDSGSATGSAATTVVPDPATTTTGDPPAITSGAVGTSTGTTAAIDPTTGSPPDLPPADTTGTTSLDTATTADVTSTTGALDLPPCDTDDEHLLACYDLEDLDQGLLVDGSGNNHHGTVMAAETVPGVTGEALRIGPQTHAIVPSTPALNPVDLSISVWLRLTAAPATTAAVVAKGGQYSLAVTPTRGILCTVGAFTLGVDAVLDLDRWTHIVFTYDEGEGHLYLDGLQLVSSVSAPFAIVGPDPLTLGCNDATCSIRLAGAEIDRVRLWDAPVSDDIICAESGC